jgi:hypothetical protein
MFSIMERIERRFEYYMILITFAEEGAFPLNI